MNRAAFGKRLAKIRKARGFTQFSLCIALGTSSPMQVSKWERGIEAPNASNLDSLGRVLNVPIECLTTGRGLREVAA